MTVPKPVRQALGVDGEEAVVRVELEVRAGKTLAEADNGS